MDAPQGIWTPQARSEGVVVLEDDYFQVWHRFEDIIRSKSWNVLPAGIETQAEPPDYPIPNVHIQSSKDLHCYNMDVRGRLDTHKKHAISFYHQLFGESFETDEITLFPSSTQAMLAVLMSRNEDASHNIVFETPSYFGGIYQAKHLGYTPRLLITSESEEFEADQDSAQILLQEVGARFILILTEPKFATGHKRNYARLKRFLGSLPKTVIVVVDEAPTLEFGIREDYNDALRSFSGDIYRIRGITKGLGLNGVKAAVLKHPRIQRSSLSSVHDTISGSLDAYSLKYIEAISQVPQAFNGMLEAAKKTVKSNAKLFAALVEDKHILTAKIDSGFFGAAKIDLGNYAASEFPARRELFLAHAEKLQTPLVSGTSLYLPSDRRYEWVRINFYLERSELIKSAQVLNEISANYHLQAEKIFS